MNILHGKLDGAYFWKNTHRNHSIVDSDLAECLMLESSGDPITQDSPPFEVTRPVIAMPWNFNSRTDYAPIIARAIRDNGAIPFKVEVDLDEVSPELLHQEVIKLISAVGNKYPTEILSIPSELLKQALENSEMGKIKSKIASVLQFCSGLALPGGSDLQPEFYGAKRDVRTDPANDYRRSIIEFALLFYSEQSELPTMGTCRGAQLINVYFGGTLNQHVEDQIHRGDLQLVRLSESQRKDEFLSYFGSDFFPSFSVHHQAIAKVGKNLEIICEFEGIPKLLLSPTNQYIASQVHPEMYMETDKLSKHLQPAKCGKLIYKLFLEKVTQYQKSKHLSLIR